jgi:hypothetical protein
MRPLYGRSLKGTLELLVVPRIKAKNFSIAACMCSEGLIEFEKSDSFIIYTNLKNLSLN